MKFIEYEMDNAIGFYNGMGLYNLKIDLSKSKYNKLVIRGGNGSGKSTFLKTLSMLPDPPSIFIPKLEGKKQLTLVDDDKIYKFKLIYPLDKNGDRTTTKGYITKIHNGEIKELNPTGNITSYKDAIDLEFNLDPNFMALSQLSTDNKGIAGKSPSERKQFASKIVAEAQQFNAINKTISKRATFYRSMMSRLESKIESLPTEDEIMKLLVSIENRISVMDNSKVELSNKISNLKAEFKMIDPDNKIQDRYAYIYDNISAINLELKNLDFIKNDILVKFNMSDIKHEEIQAILRDLDNRKLMVGMELEQLVLSQNKLLAEKEEDANILNIKTAKLYTLKSDINAKAIKNKIKDLETKIIEYRSILDIIGFGKDINMSKDEYTLALNALKEMKEYISAFKSGIDSSIINEVVYEYILKDIKPTIDMQLHTTKSELEEAIASNKSKIQYFQAKIQLMADLDIRPKGCKIDTCGFIKTALEALNENPVENINTLTLEIDEYESLLRINNSLIKHNLDIVEYAEKLSQIARVINKYRSVISKLPNGNTFIDYKKLVLRIINNDSFSDIDTIYDYIGYCDVLDMYSAATSDIYRLKADYTTYESREELIAEIVSNIETLNASLNTIYENLYNLETDIINKNAELDLIISSHETYSKLAQVISSIDAKASDKNALIAQFNNIRDAMQALRGIQESVTTLESELSNINSMIKPLKDDRDTMKYNLKQLGEYRSEYQEFVSNYAYIDAIKEHSSVDGIQVVFMELYMGKIISMANQLLSFLFDGEYSIGKFIINENEFRIPCMGNGIMNDDISSMSHGQIAIIATVLSFSMLRHSSTSFNIPTLDEMDGVLDDINRIQYLYTIDRQLEILNVEQCVMVSHNPELDLSSCDIIMFKMSSNLSSATLNSGGNIIFKF